MRFFILFFISLSLISCGGPRKIEKEEGDTNIKIGPNINLYNNKREMVNIRAIVQSSTKWKRNKKVKCRGMDGCLRVCEYFDNSECKQYSVRKVISLWRENIHSYVDLESFKKDLELIATDPDVSSFLKNVDSNNIVLRALMSKNKAMNQAQCPFASMEDRGIQLGYSTYAKNNVRHHTLQISPVIQEDDQVAIDKQAKEEALMSAVSAEEATAEEWEKIMRSKDDIDGKLNKVRAQLADRKEKASTAAQKVSDAQSALNNALEKVESAKQNIDKAEGEDEKAATEKALGMAMADKDIAARNLEIAQKAKKEADSSVEHAVKNESNERVLFEKAAALGEKIEAKLDALSQDVDTAKQEFDQSAMAYQAFTDQSRIIADSSVVSFDLYIFTGFLKKCFGHQQRTFSEMAAEIQNKSAFEIGHAVLSKACGGNNECIRLAYCSIGSEIVWSYVKEDLKVSGCEYDSFVYMLPEPEAEPSGL